MIYRFRLADGSVIETDGDGVTEALQRAKAAYRLEHECKRAPTMETEDVCATA